MTDTKKRTFATDTRATSGLRLSAAPVKTAPRGAGLRSRNPELTDEQRRELVHRLIEFLKGL